MHERLEYTHRGYVVGNGTWLHSLVGCRVSFMGYMMAAKDPKKMMKGMMTT